MAPGLAIYTRANRNPSFWQRGPLSRSTAKNSFKPRLSFLYFGYMRTPACILILLLAACGSGKSSSTAATEGVVKDKQVELGQYTVSVYSMYRPDSLQKLNVIDSVNLFTGNFVVVTNKATQAADTLPLEFMNYPSSPRISIKEVTRKAGHGKVSFVLTWMGESDNDYSVTIGYVNGVLTEKRAAQ